MAENNWVPISKAFTQFLPHNRPYTELEAAYSLQVDYDNGAQVSTAGLAKLWQWSRKRVVNFITTLEVEISYTRNTNEIQNQRGQIAVQIERRCGADRRQIKFIDSKKLRDEKSRCGTDKEQIGDRYGSTTKKHPNPNNNISSDFFEKLWAVYPRKDGRKEAERHFAATVKTDEDMELINLALGNYIEHVKDTEKRFIKTGKVWFNNWRDWIPEGLNADDAA